MTDDPHASNHIGRDIWSAGHGGDLVMREQSMAEAVDDLHASFGAGAEPAAPSVWIETKRRRL